MLTAVVARPGKPVRELRRDLAVIVAIQLAAFAYGISSIAIARPVYISFEIDRFRVVTAADIETKTLADAPAALRSLPWLGPKEIAAIKPADPAEQMRAIDLGLAGFDLSMVPKYWRDYSTQRDAAWKRAQPLAALAVQVSAAGRRCARHCCTDRPGRRKPALSSPDVAACQLVGRGRSTRRANRRLSSGRWIHLMPQPEPTPGGVSWAAAACVAVALPTLIAFNVAPSATFFNQAAAFVGWGGFLLVLAVAAPRWPVRWSPGHLALLGRAGPALLFARAAGLGVGRRTLVALTLVGGNDRERASR